MEEHLEAVAVGEQFLHTSPEFAMKRVLGTGLCRIYQIGPSYREEEVGVHHSREFTMLEWYRANAGTPEIMDEVESLVASAAAAIGIPEPNFTRISVAELRLQAGLSETDDEEEWFRGWVDRVEPTLKEPVIVHSYPVWQAALAQERRGFADRFEVYLGGIELANCFAEEGDSRVIRQRFHSSAKKRREMERVPHPIDEALLEALPRMPRTAGIALGIDRLVMALTDTSSIGMVQVR
jgi:lysyl-tRNA synthetase class 2